MQDRDDNASATPDGDAGKNTESPAAPEARKGLGVLQVVSSVFAAGLGVQSSRNRERDFSQGRAGSFIVAGLVFTALFIGAVLTVVKLVLAGAD